MVSNGPCSEVLQAFQLLQFMAHLLLTLGRAYGSQPLGELPLLIPPARAGRGGGSPSERGGLSRRKGFTQGLNTTFSSHTQCVVMHLSRITYAYSRPEISLLGPPLPALGQVLAQLSGCSLSDPGHLVSPFWVSFSPSRKWSHNSCF